MKLKVGRKRGLPVYNAAFTHIFRHARVKKARIDVHTKPTDAAVATH